MCMVVSDSCYLSFFNPSPGYIPFFSTRIPFFYHMGKCKDVTVTQVTYTYIKAHFRLFSSLTLPFVLRTCSRPQNIELGPVPSCDHSLVISCSRQVGLHEVPFYSFLPWFVYIIHTITYPCQNSTLCLNKTRHNIKTISIRLQVNVF